MRSYHSHVTTLLSGPIEVLGRKPTFRASAIFPVKQNAFMSTRILFMGYWMEKRQINEITNVATLRTEEGKLVCRTSQLIRDTKAYRLELGELLRLGGLEEEEFTGSIEVEFFSGVNLMFPYPAAVVNYYGPHFSSVVHTAQRVYNDYEDMVENSETSVPESGFNIYADDHREPFISLVNGCEGLKESLFEMVFFNAEGATLTYELDMGALAPYQTKYIYPARLTDLKGFLKGKPGACKVRFKVNWVYPRLIVGNFQKNPSAMNITHTYYDCSAAVQESDYWFAQQPDWYPATLMVPMSVDAESCTTIYFYPILSPSTLAIDVEVYDENGKILGKKEQALRLNAPLQEYKKIELKALSKELSIDPSQARTARIIARPLDGSRLPARIKLGLDKGKSQNALPCNICTNLLPFNPKLDEKPHCFRWGPCLADQENPSLWFVNSSAAVQYNRSADVKLLFHRESDNRMIERNFTLLPHGSKTLLLRQDSELWEFFECKPGWFTATSHNPSLNTYYFAEHSSGFVGGDHGF